MSAAQLKSQAGRIAVANAVIAKKTVNWLGFLDHLEEVVPAGVALVEITPDRMQTLKIREPRAASGTCAPCWKTWKVPKTSRRCTC